MGAGEAEASLQIATMYPMLYECVMDDQRSGVEMRQCVEEIVRGEGDEYSITYEARDVLEIANKVRAVPDEFINERGNYVTEECSRYILPMICGEIYPESKDGLPVHFVFD